MKLTKFIASSTLAAGVVAASALTSQAGVVIGNELFAPMDVKATLVYVAPGGKFQKVSFNNKDILAASGYDQRGNQIAFGLDRESILVINVREKSVVADLIYEGYADFYFDSYIETGKDGKKIFKNASRGYFDAYFYDYFEGGYSTVDIYGNALVKYKEKWNNSVPVGKAAKMPAESTPNYQVTFSFEANNVEAESYDYYDGEGEGYDNYLPGTGSINGSAVGKLTDFINTETAQ